MLDERQLIALLQRHALITPAEVQGGSIRITRVDRRNQNHRVHTARGRDLFVKHGSSNGETGTMAREAAVYELLAHPSIDERAGEYLIRCLGYDAAARAVVLEGVPGAEDLHAYHLRIGRLSGRLAAQLGTALGRLHRATRFIADAPAGARLLSPVRPWVCELPCPGVELLREASAVNLKVVALLQRAPTFERELEALLGAWRTESLIHGDLKLANCLTHKTRPSGGKRGLKVVDWELAGLGDPRWDVASVLSSYLALWVCSIPMPRPERPELLAGQAGFEHAAIQRTIRSFVASYRCAAQLESADGPDWLRATVRMTGAHLVQTAYEYASTARELTAPILALLQLALNVFERPERASTELLGIPTALEWSVVARTERACV